MVERQTDWKYQNNPNQFQFRRHQTIVEYRLGKRKEIKKEKKKQKKIHMDQIEQQ